MTRDYKKELENIMDAVSDVVLEMSDEEIRQEIIEDGEDPDAVAEKTRQVLHNAANGFTHTPQPIPTDEAIRDWEASQPKVIKFLRASNGYYGCDTEGDNVGEYVRLEEYQADIEKLNKALWDEVNRPHKIECSECGDELEVHTDEVACTPCANKLEAEDRDFEQAAVQSKIEELQAENQALKARLAEAGISIDQSDTFLLNSVSEILYGCGHLIPDGIEPDREVIKDVWVKFTAWVREKSKEQSNLSSQLGAARRQAREEAFEQCLHIVRGYACLNKERFRLEFGTEDIKKAIENAKEKQPC